MSATTKDLVSAKSRTDINKEMEAFETFGHVLRDTFDGAPSEVEIGYALVQPTEFYLLTLLNILILNMINGEKLRVYQKK